MAGVSKKTTLITLRLSNDTLKVLTRRARRNNVPIRVYLQNRVEYDTLRKHIRGNEIVAP